MPVIGAGHRGDVYLGETHYFLFNTVDVTGAPIAFATATPTLAAYVNGSVTQITAGLTLTQALDGVVGLHLVTCVFTSGNGYAAATDLDITLESAATVDGVVVLGKKIASYSIQFDSSLRPSVAQRQLVVNSSGQTDVGAIIGSATAANGLYLLGLSSTKFATVIAGSSASVVVLDATLAFDPVGMIAVWLDASVNLKGSAIVTDYTAGPPSVTVSPALSGAPPAGAFIVFLPWGYSVAERLHTQAKADVNAEVVAARAGSIGALSAGAPADVTTDAGARGSFLGMFRAMFNRFYDKVEQTDNPNGTRKVYNDSDTLVSTMTTSDDTTTQTKGKSS